MDLHDAHDHFLIPKESHPETQCNSSLPPPSQEQECKGDAIVPTSSETSQPYYPMLYPAYFPPFFPVTFPMWAGPANNQEVHKVLKPQAVHCKNTINVNELVGMSRLSLGDSSLSLTHFQGSSRKSAFHAKAVPGSSAMSSSSSPVPAAL